LAAFRRLEMDELEPRPLDDEAVATGEDRVGELGPDAEVGEIAPRDHGDAGRGRAGESPEDLAHRRGEAGVGGRGCDGREGAIEVRQDEQGAVRARSVANLGGPRGGGGRGVHYTT